MIPSQGYAVAVGDMIKVRTVSATELGAVIKWIHPYWQLVYPGLSKETIFAIFRQIAEREDAHIVEVTISHRRGAALVGAAAAQPEAEEGEY